MWYNQDPYGAKKCCKYEPFGASTPLFEDIVVKQFFQHRFGYIDDIIVRIAILAVAAGTTLFSIGCAVTAVLRCGTRWFVVLSYAIQRYIYR